MKDHLLAALGWLLVAVSGLCFLFLLNVVHRSDLADQQLVWLTAGSHVAAWSLLWPSLRRPSRKRRGDLVMAGVLMAAGAALVSIGVGQYQQWRQYRHAPVCPPAEPTPASPTPAGRCISEQNATVESLHIHFPDCCSYYDRQSETAGLRFADGHTQNVEVLPPGIPYFARMFPDFAQHNGPFCIVNEVTGDSFEYCRLPVTVRLYHDQVTRLTVPAEAASFGQAYTVATGYQPGRYRLVAWLGALFLLAGLWPLLPLGLLNLNRCRPSVGAGGL